MVLWGGGVADALCSLHASEILKPPRRARSNQLRAHQVSPGCQQPGVEPTETNDLKRAFHTCTRSLALSREEPGYALPPPVHHTTHSSEATETKGLCRQQRATPLSSCTPPTRSRPQRALTGERETHYGGGAGCHFSQTRAPWWRGPAMQRAVDASVHALAAAKCLLCLPQRTLVRSRPAQRSGIDVTTSSSAGPDSLASPSGTFLRAVPWHGSGHGWPLGLP